MSKCFRMMTIVAPKKPINYPRCKEEVVREKGAPVIQLNRITFYKVEVPEESLKNSEQSVRSSSKRQRTSPAVRSSLQTPPFGSKSPATPEVLECALTLSALKKFSRDDVAISPLLIKVNDLASPVISIARKKRQDNSGLHSGKWSPEENNYADCIVAHFRSGSLRLPNGSTLRAVLAEKLGCSPMRVTKTMSDRANGNTTGHLTYKRDMRLSNETMAAAQEELDMLACIFQYAKLDSY